jgi:hypothetical protein
MSETKTKFRTNQEEYFEPLDNTDDVPPPASNGKFLTMIATGVLIAVTLAALLSVKF